jgi:hypothetical protein
MSSRRGRPRTAAASNRGAQSSAPGNLRFRIVIRSVSDEGKRIIADHTVDAYVAAIGRRLPTRQFEHNTLLGGPPDLAVIIPDAMAYFVEKHGPAG